MITQNTTVVYFLVHSAVGNPDHEDYELHGIFHSHKDTANEVIGNTDNTAWG